VRRGKGWERRVVGGATGRGGVAGVGKEKGEGNSFGRKRKMRERSGQWNGGIWFRTP
jgi:hypothetical protein